MFDHSICFGDDGMEGCKVPRSKKPGEIINFGILTEGPCMNLVPNGQSGEGYLVWYMGVVIQGYRVQSMDYKTILLKGSTIRM